MSKKYAVFLLLFSIFLGGSYATHSVGGYFRYECNGLVGAALDSVEYDIQFLAYRDSTNGNPLADLPPEIPVTIFDDNNVFESLVNLQQDSVLILFNDISNPCLVSNDVLIIEEGYYSGTIRVSRNKGHILAYQRCCKNELDNIANSGNQGNTFTIDLPEFDLVGCNTSPTFDNDLQIAFCATADLAFEGLSLASTDADGDSIAYKFCEAFNYANQTIPAPVIALSPVTWVTVPFSLPQTFDDPVPSNPAVVIDVLTGEMTGVPLNAGEIYMISVCVEEYRNGRLISTLRREFQITTANCDPAVTTVALDQEQFCAGFDVQFRDSSFSPDFDSLTYKWDFGDPTTDADTSIEKDPRYTYPQEGTYEIILTVNPDLPCSSADTVIFEVLPLLDPQVNAIGNLCVEGHDIDFAAGGTFESDATFLWEFGPFANIPTSTLDTVRSLQFSGGGVAYPVKLTVNQDNCTEVVDTIIQLIDNPNINFTYRDSADCSPFPVEFINLSDTTSSPEYDWDFGDGNVSTDRNPTNVYLADGKYTVSLELRTTQGCIDTVSLTKDSVIVVSLDSTINNIDFDIVPSVGCVPLTVQFVNNSTFDGTPEYFWDFQDGSPINQERSPTKVYTDTGTYSVGLLIVTTGKCADDLVKIYNDTIRVNPVPISDLVFSDTVGAVKNTTFRFDGSRSQFSVQSSFLIDGIEVDTMEILDYQFQDSGRHLVQYIAINELGCTDTSSVEVFTFDEFEFVIPNVFTPNGDGMNDEFAIRACGVYEYDILIFNRYGERVFKSNSLNINWDGRVSGRNAESGVYLYTIRIRDFRGLYLDYQGTLTLIRN